MNVRKFATVAVAASLLLGTAGCTFMNPIATRIMYAPSDGADASVPNVDARNFMYLTNGTDAALFGSLVNHGLNSSNVKLEYKDAATGGSKQAQFTLLAGQKLDFGYNGTAALKFDLPKKLGGLVSVWLSADNQTGAEIRVPVLDGTLSEYAPLVAQLGTAATAAPTASATPSPTPTN